MERRNCCEVINKMLEKIPHEKIDLIEDLKLNYDDACFKAPEETIQWHRTQQTLIKHISKPIDDWHFEILSIFTTQPIGELKRFLSEDE